MNNPFLPLALALATLTISLPEARAEPPLAPDPAASDHVVVHVLQGAEHMQKRIKLYREPTDRDTEAGRASPSLVCAQECDAAVDLDPQARFFFDGPGMPSSRRFRLDDQRGDVAIAVAGGNKVMYGLGITLIATGAVGAVVSTTLAFATSSQPAGFSHEQVVPLLVGSVAYMVGGAVLLHFGRTRFSIAPGTGAKRDIAHILGEGLLRGGTFSF